MISKYSYTKRTTPIEIGKKYGRLTVLAKTSRRKGTHIITNVDAIVGKSAM